MINDTQNNDTNPSNPPHNDGLRVKHDILGVFKNFHK